MPLLIKFVAFLTNVREASAAYIRGHLSTAIFIQDFLLRTKANPSERPAIEEIIEATQIMHSNVSHTYQPVSAVSHYYTTATMTVT